MAPEIALRLVRWGARRTGSQEAIKRYSEEWSANLEHVPGHFTKLTWACGLLLWTVPTLRWRAHRRSSILKRSRFTGWRWVLKAIIDRLVAFVALSVIFPFLLIIALVIKIESPGPVLFRQQRVGKAGEQFSMLKLRSMVVDAEQRRAELVAANGDAGPLFKMRRDPRVTRVGAFLRRYSIDELPQLVNVLRGEMSLVGPRPPLPKEVEWYSFDACITFADHGNASSS